MGENQTTPNKFRFAHYVGANQCDTTKIEKSNESRKWDRGRQTFPKYIGLTTDDLSQVEVKYRKLKLKFHKLKLKFRKLPK